MRFHFLLCRPFPFTLPQKRFHARNYLGVWSFFCGHCAHWEHGKIAAGDCQWCSLFMTLSILLHVVFYVIKLWNKPVCPSSHQTRLAITNRGAFKSVAACVGSCRFCYCWRTFRAKEEGKGIKDYNQEKTLVRRRMGKRGTVAMASRRLWKSSGGESEHLSLFRS